MKRFYTIALVTLSVISLQLSAIDQQSAAIKQQRVTILGQSQKALTSSIQNLAKLAAKVNASQEDVATMQQHSQDIKNAIKAIVAQINAVLALHTDDRVGLAKDTLNLLEETALQEAESFVHSNS